MKNLICAKVFILTLSSFFLSSNIFSQPLFNRGYQYGQTVYNLKLTQLPTGNYFLYGGGSESGTQHGFLGKLNHNGNLLWANDYLCSNYGTAPTFKTVIIDSDQNIIFAATDEYANGYLIKTDTQGNFLWTRHLYFPFRDVLLTNDGNYLAVGSAYVADADSDWDIHIYKFAHDGSTIWRRHYYTNNYFSFFNYETKIIYNAAETSTGDFLILFDERQGNPGTKCVMKITSSGAIIWLKKYFDDAGSPFGPSLWKILALSDGNFLVCGKQQTAPPTQELSAFKINSDGNVLWSKRYTYNHDVALYNAFQLPNKNVILYGIINAPNFQNDPVVLTIDSVGHLLSSFKIKPQTELSYLYPDWFGIISPQRFALTQAGGNDPYGYDTTEVILVDSDYYSSCTYNGSFTFIELNDTIAPYDSLSIIYDIAVPADSTPLISTPRVIADEDLCLATESTLPVNDPQFQVSPVPSTDFITITLEHYFEIASLQLITTFGQKAYESEWKGNQSSVTIDVSHLPEGIYWVVMKTESNMATKKLVIQR